MLKLVETNRTISAEALQASRQSLEVFLNRTDIGFFQLPMRQELWVSSKRWGTWLSDRFDNFVLVGIGGSSLGPQFLADIATSPKRVMVADNVDPWQFQKITQSFSDWSKVGFILISKSGSTLETLVTAENFAAFLKSKGLSLAEQSLVVTEPKSNSLSDWAVSHKVPQLEIPFDVGGRFSILSPVGMVVAQALGLDLEELRKGAQQTLCDQELVAQLAAEARASFLRQEWITFFWNYSSALKYFGMWFQQLWAESLAKSVDRKGKPALRVSTPVAAIGTCDQHSLLQQVMEGAHDKWVLQIRVKQCESQGLELSNEHFNELKWLPTMHLGRVLSAEAAGTIQALHQSDVSYRVLELEDLGPKSVGYLIMFWQLVVACLGEQLDLNAFDQPGVELGKRLAKQILKEN